MKVKIGENYKLEHLEIAAWISVDESLIACIKKLKKLQHLTLYFNYQEQHHALSLLTNNKTVKSIELGWSVCDTPADGNDGRWPGLELKVSSFITNLKLLNYLPGVKLIVGGAET
jgi:hypothetical protein